MAGIFSSLNEYKGRHMVKNRILSFNANWADGNSEKAGTNCITSPTLNIFP
jgi:hypothetical protein